MFFKKLFLKEIKRIKNYVPNSNLYLYFFIKQNLLISSAKAMISAKRKRWVRLFIHFWVFFRYGINVPRFIIVWYLWQVWGKGTFLALFIGGAAWKMSILSRCTTYCYSTFLKQEKAIKAAQRRHGISLRKESKTSQRI